jgi:hypothetical protein
MVAGVRKNGRRADHAGVGSSDRDRFLDRPLIFIAFVDLTSKDLTKKVELINGPFDET